MSDQPSPILTIVQPRCASVDGFARVVALQPSEEQHRTIDVAEWLRRNNLPPLERATEADTFLGVVGDRFRVFAEVYKDRWFVVLQDRRGARINIPLDSAVDVSKFIDRAVTCIVAHEVKKGRQTP